MRRACTASQASSISTASLISQRRLVTPAAIAGEVYHLLACQVQFSFPEIEPEMCPDVRRPLQCWVTIATVRVKEICPPPTSPPEMVPTSPAVAPSNVPVNCPPDASESVNAPL